MEVVLTGIKPTGKAGTLHIGNYVGAMKPAVAASRNPNVQSYYFLADYHAIGGDADSVARSTLEIAASWLAVGLDPEQGRALSAVRHPRDPRAHLDPAQRDGQGPDESRARLQGRGRRERGDAGRRSRSGDHDASVFVPDPDGRGHLDVQRGQGAGRQRPEAARRDGARHRAALQPPLRRDVRAARRRDRRQRGDAARPRRPQDEQELRQRRAAVRRARKSCAS